RRARGARRGGPGPRAQAARPRRGAHRPVYAGGIRPGRAAAADADLRRAGPAAHLLPAVRRDRSRGGGPPRAADLARQAAGAGALRRAAGHRRRRCESPPGGAAADADARPRPTGPRPRAGAVREGRRVAVGAARCAAHMGADVRRLPERGPRLLALRLPPGCGGGAPMRRALPLLLLLSCARRDQHEAPRPNPGEVWLSREQIESQQMRIGVVGEELVATSLEAPGRIAFDDLHVAHVFAPVSGRIAKIDASPGQHVRKGDSLLEIESPDVGAAFADVGKAEADLAASERELKRQRELVEAHAAAQRELDQAQNANERARAELARARHRAELFRTRGVDRVSQRFSLRSPIDGEVIARTANPGTEIQGQLSGGVAAELFTVGSLDSVWAYADVYEADLARVKLGAPVQVKVIAYPDRTFPARIEWMSSVLDPVTRTVRLRCPL